MHKEPVVALRGLGFTLVKGIASLNISRLYNLLKTKYRVSDDTINKADQALFISALICVDLRLN